jgi:tetratricopeptide (TPR) repeat protein
MSEVFRARDAVLGRFVAIKMIAADLASGDETRERFFREAKSVGSLAHRNIITVYDFGEDNGRPYIVMELLEGESLTRLMAREPDMPIERRIDIMMRVCEGLAYAHQHDIVHRDVKPANLFVTTDGQLKILDFGVARIAQSTLTAAGILVGTPDYMSPEQVEGRAVDQRSDVFSAGAVFYQLLSGRKPFEAKRLPELLQKVATEEPVKLTEQQSPPELSAIVTRALEKDATRRYQRIQDMLADLARVQQAFDRQTRALATRACDRYREIEQMLDDGAALASQLGVAVEPEEVSVAPMLRELPLFQDHGADVLRLVPMRRAKVAEITRLLQRQYEALATRNASWRSALSLVSTAEALIKDRDFTSARATLEEAIAAAPDAPKVQGLLEQCRFELKQAGGAPPAASGSHGPAPTEPMPIQGDARDAPVPEPSKPARPPRGRDAVAVTAAIDKGLAKPSAKGSAIDLDLRKRGAARVPPAQAAPPAVTSEATESSGRSWMVGAGVGAVVLLLLVIWLMRGTTGDDETARSQAGTTPAATGPVELSEPAVVAPPPEAPPATAAPDTAATEPVPSDAPSGGAPSDAALIVPTRPASTEAAAPEAAEPGEPANILAAGKRPGESIEDWRTRSRSLTMRYLRGRQALDRGQFADALALLTAIDREEPNYGDTPQLIRTARAGVRGRAQALVDQGARQAARGEYAAAQASYEEAQRLLPGVDVTSGAVAALRETMRAAGEEAFRRAGAEEGAGRTANALGLYRRAVELLPPGDATRARAEGRLRALAPR